MGEAAEKVSETKLRSHDFSQFTKAFEKNIVKLILKDRGFASQMQEVLELNYFQDDSYKIMVDCVFKYKEKYGCHPAFDTIDVIFNNDIKTDGKTNNVLVKNLILNFWNTFKVNPIVEDADYFTKTALDFCRSQRLTKTIHANLGRLDSNDFDGFMEEVSKAAVLGSSQNFGHSYSEDIEKRYSKDVRQSITTGWSILDGYSKGPITAEDAQGGIGIGETFVYVAPQSQGKTSRMVYTATQNLLLGRNVVFFTLGEMSEEEIGLKFDACLSEIYLDQLFKNVEHIKDRVRDLPGKLQIIEEDMDGTTPRRLFNKCKKLNDTGFPVDLVCCDSIDYMSPSKAMGRDDSMLAGGVQVYKETVSLNRKLGYRFLTCAQTNREGAEADILTQKHFQDAFKRFNPCHLVVGFSSKGKVSTLKTRVGPQFLLEEHRDLGRVHTDIYEPDANSLEALEKELTKKPVIDTKEALANFLKSKAK